jgi:hypothetical protein
MHLICQSHCWKNSLHFNWSPLRGASNRSLLKIPTDLAREVISSQFNPHFVSDDSIATVKEFFWFVSPDPNSGSDSSFHICNLSAMAMPGTFGNSSKAKQAQNLQPSDSIYPKLGIPPPPWQALHPQSLSHSFTQSPAILGFSAPTWPTIAKNPPAPP